jgi:hypothetical protein
MVISAVSRSLPQNRMQPKISASATPVPLRKAQAAATAASRLDGRLARGLQPVSSTRKFLQNDNSRYSGIQFKFGAHSSWVTDVASVSCGQREFVEEGGCIPDAT